MGDGNRSVRGATPPRTWVAGRTLAASLCLGVGIGCCQGVGRRERASGQSGKTQDGGGAAPGQTDCDRRHRCGSGCSNWKRDLFLQGGSPPGEGGGQGEGVTAGDRKSTRLNSSHL